MNQVKETYTYILRDTQYGYAIEKVDDVKGESYGS